MTDTTKQVLTDAEMKAIVDPRAAKGGRVPIEDVPVVAQLMEETDNA